MCLLCASITIRRTHSNPCESECHVFVIIYRKISIMYFSQFRTKTRINNINEFTVVNTTTKIKNHIQLNELIYISIVLIFMNIVIAFNQKSNEHCLTNCYCRQKKFKWFQCEKNVAVSSVYWSCHNCFIANKNLAFVFLSFVGFFLEKGNKELFFGHILLSFKWSFSLHLKCVMCYIEHLYKNRLI